MFLAEMGLGEHQAVYALHRDTHNWHVHIAVNRVHPTTEKVVTVNNGFDLEIAHRAIARIEQSQGWEREARGLYAVGTDGRVGRLRPREQGERQPSARARDLEERTGQRSAERIAIEEAGTIIRQARSWRELHTALAVQGMRYEKKGSGALIWIGDRPIKASTAGRDCSMAALRGRLGDFEPALPAPAPASIPTRAVDESAPTLRVYLDERREHYRERDARRARATREQRGEWRDLADHHRKERADIFRGSWRGRGDLLNATRSVLAARQAQEKAAVRERQQLERAALRRERGGFLVTRTGSPAAIAIRRTDGGTAIGGPPPSRARPSRSPRRGTFAPSPLSSRAGRSITISRDRGAPPSRTTGRRSTSMPAETARASWRPCSSARRSGGPFRCMATGSSCASVSNWPPSTASGSPIPTFKSRSRPSANGTGDKTRPTLTSRAWGLVRSL